MVKAYLLFLCQWKVSYFYLRTNLSLKSAKPVLLLLCSVKEEHHAFTLKNNSTT